jgi:hypothetical protein
MLFITFIIINIIIIIIKRRTFINAYALTPDTKDIHAHKSLN